MEGRGLFRIVETEEGKLEINYIKQLERIVNALVTIGVQNDDLRGVILAAAEMILASSENYASNIKAFEKQCDLAYETRIKEQLSDPIKLALAMSTANKSKS